MDKLDLSALDLTPAALLPHADPMILVDSVVSYDGEAVTTQVLPEPGKPFADDSGNVPGWVGMEYMAQTIGAYAGIQAQLAGEPVKTGFLLGTRRYELNTGTFQRGLVYNITARKLYDDNGLSAFDCSIFKDSSGEPEVVATATINTFQPENLDEYRKGSQS